MSEEQERNNLDVAIFASAIRPDLWMALYESLASTNKCSFKMFFCGHVRPGFNLPENFVHVYSEMDPAPCVEIAYRQALAENSKYIMHFTDDCIMPPGILDSLIEEHKAHGGELVVGPSFIPPCRPGQKGRPISLHMHTGHTETPLLPIFQMVKRSTAIKTGGVDKRFKAIMWDVDRLLRLHEMKTVDFKVCDHLVISEIPIPGSLYKRTIPIDGPVLDSLWDCYVTLGAPVFRKDKIIEWPEEELIYSIEEK